MSAKETTENFWKVWNSFVWPEPTTPTYRLYYHDDGTPDVYTMEDFPGKKYIEVSLEVYLAADANVRVEDGQLKFIPVRKHTRKLKPGQPTGTPCHPNDVCIVVSGSNSINWDLIND
jgi:hypothetical protein